MASQKVVTPVKTGVQIFYNHMKTLDSGFRRNDGKTNFETFYEIINTKYYTKKSRKIFKIAEKNGFNFLNFF